MAEAAQPTLVTITAEHIAGPETAKRLGVPVGTVVGTREVRKYRSKVRQLLWRARHFRSGRITMTQKGN